MATYTSGNRLLDRLSPHLLDTIRDALDVKTLDSGTILYPGSLQGPLLSVVFPISCVTSMLATMADGGEVETGTVGYEGMVGAPSAFGSRRLLERWIVQVPGVAAAMRVDDFRRLFATSDEACWIVHRYTQAYMGSLAQSGACNALHLLVERCARWLLLTHDRVRSDQFELTQEFLAMMLGVRRPGVSVAASALQSAGMISYSRGVIHIKNRAALEAAACECYRTTTREYERLFREDPREDEADLVGGSLSRRGT